MNISGVWSIKIAGVIVGDHHANIVTTQPWIYKTAEATASDDDIVRYFADRGFIKSSLYPYGGFFYNPQFNVVAADAHSRNVLFSIQGDIVPIDIVMGKPGSLLRAKLRAEFSITELENTSTANTTSVVMSYIKLADRNKTDSR